MQMEILSHWGVIEVTGEDAAAFLQSQLTQDVASLAPQRATLAAYCTAKGRILGQFVVIRNGAGYYLLTHRDMVDALVKRLSMFVLRLKCKLRNVSDASRVLGSKGPLPRPVDAVLAATSRTAPLEPWVCERAGDASEGTYVVGWPSADGLPRHLLLLTAATSERAAERVAEIAASSGDGVAAPVSSGAVAEASHGATGATGASDVKFWMRDDILCAIPFLEPANLEAFVPQMLNLDIIGGVSFSKGCYPGQEVVARSHYLGKMKRRMQIGQTAGHVAAGEDIFSSTRPTEPAGRVVNAFSQGDASTFVLFEVSSDDLQGATLHVNSHDGPVLHLKALPYDIPAANTPPMRG
jgi:folate-binding protein YgfZ